MGLFSINTEVSSSTGLKPNTIHDVIFQGIEAKEVGKEGGQKYKIIEVKFEKENGGKFNHTIFAPQRKEDMNRQSNNFGGESPSMIEQINEFCRQLMAAVNPDFYAKLKNKEKEALSKYNPNTWNDLTKQLAAIVNPNIGCKMQIKLLAKTDGVTPVFPGFLLSINKNGGLYVTSTIMGSELQFTKKEMEKISTQVPAKKTTMPKENAIQIPDDEEEIDTTEINNDLPGDDDLPF